MNISIWKLDANRSPSERAVSAPHLQWNDSESRLWADVEGALREAPATPRATTLPGAALDRKSSVSYISYLWIAATHLCLRGSNGTRRHSCRRRPLEPEKRFCPSPGFPGMRCTRPPLERPEKPRAWRSFRQTPDLRRSWSHKTASARTALPRVGPYGTSGSGPNRLSPVTPFWQCQISTTSPPKNGTNTHR